MSINFKIKKHYYNLPYYMTTIKFLKKHINNVLDLLSDFDDDCYVTDIESNVNEQAVYYLETCSEAFRQGIEHSSEDSFLCDILDDNIRINFKNDVISVFTPLTFNRKKYEYVALAKRVAIAFDKFENDNPNINLKHIYRRRDATCNVFQIRMVHKFKSYLKDNNNENGAIVNEILGNRLLISDSPQSMVTYTDMCVEVPEDYPVGMLHLVIPTEKLNLYLEDIFLKNDFFKFM